MVQIDVVIATLFRPPTLEPLVESAKKQGATVHVIEGMRVNPAWNKGCSLSEASYVCILNDDIIMEPEDEWLGRMSDLHEEGYTHILPTMHGRKASIVHRGHAFSMRKGISPPVPGDIEIAYGDDWHFLWHQALGRSCSTEDIRYKTGEDAGFEGQSGFTVQHPGVEEFLGEPKKVIHNRETLAALKYFEMRKAATEDPGVMRVYSPHAILPRLVASRQ